MAPNSSNVNGEVLLLFQSLRPENHHVFLQPNISLPTESLSIVKQTLEEFATQVGDEQQIRLKETRKRKRGGVDSEREPQDVLKLKRVYVDGFETDQVWQQAKKLIGSILRYSESALDELEDESAIVADGGSNDASPVIEGSRDEHSEISPEPLDYEVQDDDDDEQDLSDDDSLASDKDDEVEQDEDADEDEAIKEHMEEDKNEEYVEDPHGLNDGFFSIDEFNKQTQWFEDQDARGDPNTDHASDDEEVDWTTDPLAPPKGGSKKSSKHKGLQNHPFGGSDDVDEEEDGPTFGNMALDAPEGESDDEAMADEGVDDEANDFNANEIYYKEFFAPPSKKSKDKRPRRTIQAKPMQPTEEDIERAMTDVRRDLFEDETDDESEAALSDASAGDPKSRRSAHERRQAKLAEEIRNLEAASVAKREWTLIGEANATQRPMNSLLEQDLDFEHVGKPVPVITPEVTEGIEDLIKRRILAQEFDEVIRRRPDTEGVAIGTRRGMIELDDGKPNKSLAEVYEEEHIKNTNPDTYLSQSEEKLQREEKEIETMWRDVCTHLDALSSWNYKPKQAAQSLSVIADVATVSMEDAQPTTAQGVAGESSRLAPQEVYKAGADTAAKGEVVASNGLPVARQEMTREEKLRRRRRQKERLRKEGGADAGGKKPLSAKAKMQRDTMADLKKGGVKVINRKGEITDIEGKKAKVAKVASSGSYKL